MSFAISSDLSLIDYFVVVPVSYSRRLVRDICLIFCFSIILALCAQVSFYLPFTKVPITLQTLSVLLTGAVLGKRRGGLAILAYIAEGATGLPVFAGGNGGFIRMIGVTGGYIWSFPVAAYVTGWLCEKKLDRRFRSSAMAMVPGMLITYVIGVPWLAFVLRLSLPAAFTAGMLPFIAGDVFKLVIAALLLPATWRLVNKR